MRSVVWGELTGEDLANLRAEDPLVIVPLGCTEQHGLHLPTDTDTYQVERLAVEGARAAAVRHGIAVVVLPTLPYGPTAEHVGLIGAIDLPSEVYVAVIKSIVRSVIDNGFCRIGVLSGCGGHWVVPGALWDLKADAHRRGQRVTLHLLKVDADWRNLQEQHFHGAAGGHAGAMETALCLAGRPHLVREDRMFPPALDRFKARYLEGGEVFLFTEVSDTGALGDPTAATAEGGAAIWADSINAFADRLHLIDRLDRGECVGAMEGEQ